MKPRIFSLVRLIMLRARRAFTLLGRDAMELLYPSVAWVGSSKITSLLLIVAYAVFAFSSVGG